MQQSAPRAFVSYSRTSPAHCDRIRSYAERLVTDGVDVMFDDFDLKEGQDKYVFMEKMVTDPAVTHVLVFSDRRYAEKANARKAGVGTESQIISKEIYNKVEQTKFIPIVCEYQDNGDAWLPVFFKTTIYVDFSTPELANENWEKLIRLLHGKPAFKKPPLGRPPSYILEDTGVALPTRGKFAAYKDAYSSGRPSMPMCRRDFLDSVLEFVDSSRIRSEPDLETLADKMLADIRSFLPVRDQLVEWVLLESGTKSSPEFDEVLVEFLERVLALRYRPTELTRFNNSWFGAHEFIAYETFLYTCAALIRTNRFDLVAKLVSHRYLIPDGVEGGIIRSFQAFCVQLELLRRRNTQPDTEKRFPENELLGERTTRRDVTLKDLIQVDIVLLIAALFSGDLRWYPHTMLDIPYDWTPPLFLRAIERNGFDRIKHIFGVTNGDEFRKRFTEEVAKNEMIRQWQFWWRVSLNEVLRIEDIDTLP